MLANTWGVSLHSHQRQIFKNKGNRSTSVWSSYPMFKKDRIGVENTIDNDYWNVRILETEETSFFVKEIRYVHELQNAFFFITDLELQRIS